MLTWGAFSHLLAGNTVGVVWGAAGALLELPLLDQRRPTALHPPSAILWVVKGVGGRSTTLLPLGEHRTLRELPCARGSVLFARAMSQSA